MRQGIFFGIAAFWFLFGSIISGWVDGNTTFAGTLAASGLSTTGTALNVLSTSGFRAAPDYIVEDNELMVYTGMTATSFTGLVRGATYPTTGETTVASSHGAGAKVYTTEASVLSSLLGFNTVAISTAYGSFSIIDFAVGTWNFFKNIPRLLSFDYSFLKGPYNPITQGNDPSDIVLLRLALIVVFEVPGIIGLILILRTVFFGAGGGGAI